MEAADQVNIYAVQLTEVNVPYDVHIIFTKIVTECWWKFWGISGEDMQCGFT